MKTSKFLRSYSYITQGVFSIAVYALIGYFIGYAIDKDSFWPPLLLTIGVILGIITFITYLLYLIKEEEKEKKRNDSRTEN